MVMKMIEKLRKDLYNVVEGKRVLVGMENFEDMLGEKNW